MIELQNLNKVSSQVSPISYYLSGLKALFISSSSTIVSNLIPLSTLKKRYDLQEMSVSKLEIKNTLPKWTEKIEFLDEIITLYTEDKINILFRLLKKFGWRNLLLKKLFKASVVFKSFNFYKKMFSIYKRLFLTLTLIRCEKAKEISQLFVELRVNILIVSADILFFEKLIILTAAVQAGIPLLFLSENYSSEDSLIDLIYKIERDGHIVSRKINRQYFPIKSISAIYGSENVIADYCKIPISLVSIPGFWMHGWIPAYHNVHPAFVALHKQESSNLRFPWMRDAFNKNDMQLVTRIDQKIFLVNHGYMNVKVIGHPIVYLKNYSNINRISDSLLIVPPHGYGYRDENNPLVKKYIEYISSIKNEFSFIQLCVTAEDYIRKDWWPAFKKIGIENVVSVDRYSRNALSRMVDILRHFEFVTTNSFGSIITYAAYAGCKVSVSGPYVELPRQILAQAHAVVKYPQLLEKQINLCTEQALRMHYPELFTDPQLAKARVDWGCNELGNQHKLSQAEMQCLVKKT